MQKILMLIWLVLCMHAIIWILCIGICIAAIVKHKIKARIINP